MPGVCCRRRRQEEERRRCRAGSAAEAAAAGARLGASKWPPRWSDAAAAARPGVAGGEKTGGPARSPEKPLSTGPAVPAGSRPENSSSSSKDLRDFPRQDEEKAQAPPPPHPRLRPLPRFERSAAATTIYIAAARQLHAQAAPPP